MRHIIILAPMLLLCCITTASASFLDGSVTLYPIEYGSFRSVGYAKYYNDFNQPESAALSGEHVVSEVYPGSSNFVAPVTNTDYASYTYWLEGPTSPGYCYETSLHVVAIPQYPTFGHDRLEQTWYGYSQQCAPQPVYYTLRRYSDAGGYRALVGEDQILAGTYVTITAVPPSGWHFVQWSGDYYSSSANPISFVVDHSGDMIAYFEQDPPPPPHDPEIIYEDSDCPQYQNCHSPIVVNMGNGGYELTGRDNPVLFDIDASGRPIYLAWTAAGAPMGFLALDRNNNGKIDDGSELFGNHTPLPSGASAVNGFEALVPYDTNHDGIIDPSDPIWSSLLLWTDLNHDGVSQAEELLPVNQSNVVAISLDDHFTGRYDGLGNRFRFESRVWMNHSGGRATPRPVYDIFFTQAR